MNKNWCCPGQTAEVLSPKTSLFQSLRIPFDKTTHALNSELVKFCSCFFVPELDFFPHFIRRFGGTKDERGLFTCSAKWKWEGILGGKFVKVRGD